MEERDLVTRKQEERQRWASCCMLENPSGFSSLAKLLTYYQPLQRIDQSMQLHYEPGALLAKETPDGDC